ALSAAAARRPGERSAASPAAPSIRDRKPIGSCKKDRGEPPPRRHGERIGRAHRLEEFDELLARCLLVPFAVALDEIEEPVDRLLALARREERRCQLQPRVIVSGIALEALTQLAERALRLFAGLCDLEGGPRRRHL